MLEPGRISFRLVGRSDFGLLAHWLAQPHVARWWNHEFTPEAIEDDFGPGVDGTEPAEDHLVLIDGEPVGLIQYCRFDDYPIYIDEMADVYPVSEGAASIDYFVGDGDRVGRGLGRVMIARFVEQVWATDPAVTHLVVPVHADNPSSGRALLGAGFRLVARGDLEPDNPVDDRRHDIYRLDRPRS